MLSEYPKSCIEFTYEILEDDGFILTHLINSASYALQEAGIKQVDFLLASSSVALEDGTIVIDPTSKEIIIGKNVVCIGKKVVLLTRL